MTRQGGGSAPAHRGHAVNAQRGSAQVGDGDWDDGGVHGVGAVSPVKVHVERGRHKRCGELVYQQGDLIAELAAFHGGTVLPVVLYFPFVQHPVLIRHVRTRPCDACSGTYRDAARGQGGGQQLESGYGVQIGGLRDAVQSPIVGEDFHIAHAGTVLQSDDLPHTLRRAAGRLPHQGVVGVGRLASQFDARIGASHPRIVGVHVVHRGSGRGVLDGQDELGGVAVDGGGCRNPVPAGLCDDRRWRELGRRRGRCVHRQRTPGGIYRPVDGGAACDGIGGQCIPGTRQAHFPLPQYLQPRLDHDDGRVRCEFPAAQKPALVADRNPVGADGVEFEGYEVCIVHVDEGRPVGGDAPRVFRRTVVGHTVHHRLALAYIPLPADGYPVADNGYFYAEAVLAGTGAAQGSVETDDTVVLLRVAPAHREARRALPVDNTPTVDTPEIGVAIGRKGFVGDRAALAGSSIARDMQGVSLKHLDIEHLFVVAAAVVVHAVGHRTCDGDVLEGIGTRGGGSVATLPVIACDVAVPAIRLVGELHIPAAADLDDMVCRLGGNCRCRHDGVLYKTHGLLMGVGIPLCRGDGDRDGAIHPVAPCHVGDVVLAGDRGGSVHPPGPVGHIADGNVHMGGVGHPAPLASHNLLWEFVDVERPFVGQEAFRFETAGDDHAVFLGRNLRDDTAQHEEKRQKLAADAEIMVFQNFVILCWYILLSVTMVR